MNCNQAKKEVSIVDYMQRIGYKPTKITNDDYWYKSPIRIEEKASFKVNATKNLWYDFGLGYGGNIIDLVTDIHKCSISEALEVLGNKDIRMKLPKDYYSVKKDIVTDFIEQDIQDSILIKYIQERGINIDIAKIYLKELRYKVNEKEYYSIGIKNDSKGYEARNKYVKINLFGKDITTIPGKTRDVNIFEGFFDFLSYLMINKDAKNDNNIIMNSLSQLNKIIDKLTNGTNSYNDIYLYLDNDNSGILATKRIINAISKAKNMSYIYQNSKDLNDFLLVKEKTVSR